MKTLPLVSPAATIRRRWPGPIVAVALAIAGSACLPQAVSAKERGASVVVVTDKRYPDRPHMKEAYAITDAVYTGSGGDVAGRKDGTSLKITLEGNKRVTLVLRDTKFSYDVSFKKSARGRRLILSGSPYDLCKSDWLYSSGSRAGVRQEGVNLKNKIQRNAMEALLDVIHMRQSGHCTAKQLKKVRHWEGRIRSYMKRNPTTHWS